MFHCLKWECILCLWYISEAEWFAFAPGALLIIWQFRDIHITGTFSDLLPSSFKTSTTPTATIRFGMLGMPWMFPRKTRPFLWVAHHLPPPWQVCETILGCATQDASDVHAIKQNLRAHASILRLRCVKSHFSFLHRQLSLKMNSLTLW